MGYKRINFPGNQQLYSPSLARQKERLVSDGRQTDDLVITEKETDTESYHQPVRDPSQPPGVTLDILQVMLYRT